MKLSKDLPATSFENLSITLDFGNIVSELGNKNLRLLHVKDNPAWFVVDSDNNLYSIETYYAGGYLDRYIGEKQVISFEKMEWPVKNFEEWRREFMGAAEVQDFIDRIVSVEYPRMNDIVLCRADENNYLVKEVNTKDAFENYYKFYVNGSFIGGLCNKHFLDDRNGQPQDTDIDKRAVEMFMGYMERHGIKLPQFTFTPADYEAAEKALLSSGKDVMEWDSDRYPCHIEKCPDGGIYYDLHLSVTGSTIMYGESVDLLNVEENRVLLRVENDERGLCYLSKEFFDKNFSSCERLSFGLELS